jgi:hypothetical protein
MSRENTRLLNDVQGDEDIGDTKDVKAHFVRRRNMVLGMARSSASGRTVKRRILYKH